MATKKTPDETPASATARTERGRYARLLADGYTVEVTDPKSSPSKTDRPRSRRER